MSTKLSEKTWLIIAACAMASIVVGSILCFISYELYESNHEFSSNFLSNLAAECTGIGVGLILATLVASKVAKNKVIELAPRVIALIKQLREEKKITGPMARESVKCSVALISEDYLRHARQSGELIVKSCPVCELAVETDKSGRCSHCQLPGNVWDPEAFKR